MADIFDVLNHLNQQIQDGGVNIIEAEKHLKGFQKNYDCGNDEQKTITLQTFHCNNICYMVLDWKKFY